MTAVDFEMAATVIADDIRTTARMLTKAADSMDNPRTASRMTSDAVIRLASILPALGRLESLSANKASCEACDALAHEGSGHLRCRDCSAEAQP